MEPAERKGFVARLPAQDSEMAWQRRWPETDRAPAREFVRVASATRNPAAAHPQPENAMPDRRRLRLKSPTSRVPITPKMPASGELRERFWCAPFSPRTVKFAS